MILEMSNLIPKEVWIFFVALNLFMFFLNMALEMPDHMLLNLLSGVACAGAYYFAKKSEEANEDE